MGLFALLVSAPASLGHAPERQVRNLDKTPAFHHENTLQNDLLGRVLHSPEKRFPIPRQDTKSSKLGVFGVLSKAGV